MDISVLREQHDALAANANALLDQVSKADFPRPVAALRWKLARALIVHLALEDGFLYPDMLNGQDMEACNIARDFQGEMGDLAGCFTDYMARWSDDRIAGEWPRFCEETREVMGMLVERITRENERLYPLAPVRWQGDVRKTG
ncbi:hemerythrin domain-containing protein [Sphingobium sp. H39-3-25]|uniref:hemerythrin domain-containing protein n=1 Tax=Sphingobium arseniciresistens TaxID=3030834 RepID=UPI0023B8E114|nr:hemerythrin domain-containing protein [Sphingobium arseniciresistens]